MVFAHAIEADAIDSTGAGDLWASGFLCGLYKNQSLKTCGEYGALLGKTVVEILGARIDDNIWTKLKEDWK